jgi:hypothetical protein
MGIFKCMLSQFYVLRNKVKNSGHDGRSNIVFYIEEGLFVKYLET